MSTNSESPTDCVLDGLTSQAIEARLVDLIRRYVQQRSRGLARAVVRHLEALCQHPDYDGDPTQRCAYRRLAQHWRWLSRDLSPARAG